MSLTLAVTDASIGIVNFVTVNTDLVVVIVVADVNESVEADGSNAEQRTDTAGHTYTSYSLTQNRAEQRTIPLHR